MNGAVKTAREAVKSASRMASRGSSANMQPDNTDQLAFGAGSGLLDPELIKAARHIYRTFYEVHPEIVQRPIGVAIGRLNHRGKLVFGDKPVLLPQECFIPFSQIEPGLL